MEVAITSCQIVTRYRCIVCGAIKEFTENLTRGHVIIDKGQQTPGYENDDYSKCWKEVFGVWVCPNHEVEISVIIDGKVLVGYSAFSAWPPSDKDQDGVARGVTFRDPDPSVRDFLNEALSNGWFAGSQTERMAREWVEKNSDPRKS